MISDHVVEPTALPEHHSVPENNDGVSLVWSHLRLLAGRCKRCGFAHQGVETQQGINRRSSVGWEGRKVAVTSPVEVREARRIAVDEPGLRVLPVAEVQGLYGLVVVLLLQAFFCGIENVEQIVVSGIQHIALILFSTQAFQKSRMLFLTEALGLMVT